MSNEIEKKAGHRAAGAFLHSILTGVSVMAYSVGSTIQGTIGNIFPHAFCAKIPAQKNEARMRRAGGSHEERRRKGRIGMSGNYKQVTRKDVAQEAGVSETVVSYVMNNNRYVDKEKRARVQAAIQKLNYRPNTIARALKGKNTNHIVFIADQIMTEHFSQLVSEMDKEAYDLGYMISLCANRNTQAFVNEIISRHFDGIIISSISFSKQYIQQLVEANIPVVLFVNRNYDDIQGAGKIDSGLYDGARHCVQYLVGTGCRHLIYIDRFSANGHFSDMSDMRYRGFVEQMRDSGLSDDARRYVITGCASQQEVMQKLGEYLQGHPVDAIIGRNDKLACIAMQTVQRAGYCVPDDIAVMGFDDSTLCQYVTPTITSVQIQREQAARAAIAMLQKMIEKHEMPEPVAFPTRIIRRGSTR